MATKTLTLTLTYDKKDADPVSLGLFLNVVHAAFDSIGGTIGYIEVQGDDADAACETAQNQVVRNSKFSWI